ncbi:hypothetical protein INS49_001884 [Diaporthe citri]|uniref:uncharacterized protein n=1 Tax=Diaporthe citri TaxID=83186 RepID=UPI001C813229|nr:uncharacterized protein INS49_001884 [Diaporthe citri]KAG6367689.1 hypothetical protein INS49_001884 [Diaporthe citri]
MADTRPSRVDQCFTEGKPKVTVTYEVLQKTVYTHRRCDEGKDCPACNDTYHPEELQLRPDYSYRRHLTDGEAEDISTQYVSQIQGDRRYISGRLKRHADIVISRWTKNGTYGSQQKREDLLSKVAAELAKTPEDIIGFNYSQKEVTVPNRSLQCRRMLMLPWLNVEVLKTTPDALLALFHCRSAYGPSEWAAFDGEQFKGHWCWGFFDCDHSCKTIVLYGEEEYGSLVDWDAGQIHRGDTVGFPFGILVLEAQAYLMGVLRKALDTILQGIDDSHPIRTVKWQQATATGTFRRTNDIEPWSSFTWGAFCAPPKFDMAYWASLAQSRREKAEDHLRALQCDPAYMRRSIRVVADSAQWSQISAKTKGMWFTGKICEAMESYYLWRFMEGECQHVDEPKTDHMFNRVCTETGPHLLKVFQQSKPPQGLKGQAWIKQQKELRSSLSTFWDSVRELNKDDYSRTDLSAEEAEELLKAISADLCPEHQKAVKDEEDAVYASMKKPREMLTAATTVFIGEGHNRQTRKYDLGHVKNKKNKKKTRPDEPADVRAEEPPCDLGKLSLEGEAPGAPIVVPRKVFEDFVCKVFPAEKNEGKQGVDWQTFVRGMAAVGCSVTNSGGGGSEVLFSHELFGKITFHKPHPEPRVDTIKLHAWAQRLQRRFGWSREQFVVASVQPSQATEGSKDKSELEKMNESKAS